VIEREFGDAGRLGAMAAPADQNLYAVSGSLWARKLASKETAEAFHASWDQACDAVEYVVSWGPVDLQVSFLRVVKSLRQKGRTL
jgi:hypothetical protein